MASNFCRNCGFRLTEGKSFCGNCGTMVVRRDPVAAAPAQPEQAPVQAAPAAAAPVIAAEPAPAEAVPAEPVITPEPASAPAPSVTVSPEAESISPMPQPMQTVVTYHPDEAIKVDLTKQALRPVEEVAHAEEPVEVIEAFPIVPAAPGQTVPSALTVAAPVVPAVPAAAPAAPAAPVSSAAPAPAAAPKKKSHVGLIIGLVCGGIVLIGLLCFGMIMMFADDLVGNNGSGTVLDRIETMEEASSGKNYTIYNKSFDRKIESVKWWDYDGTMKSQGVYYMNTKTLAFSIQVEENTSEKLYYAFFYSKDDNFTKNDLKEAEYSDYISPSYYKDGNTYYNIECEKSLKPGHYCVIVSKDKNFKKPYAVAYAKILDEKSEVG